MSDPFALHQPGLNDPGLDLVPASLSDTQPEPEAFRALYITVGGTIKIVTKRSAGRGEGEEDILRTIVVPDNFLLPVCVVRVHSTGTDATGIIGIV